MVVSYRGQAKPADALAQGEIKQMECQRLVHSAVIFAAKSKRSVWGVFYSSSQSAGRHHVFFIAATMRRNTLRIKELRKLQELTGQPLESNDPLQRSVDLG